MIITRHRPVGGFDRLLGVLFVDLVVNHAVPDLAIVAMLVAGIVLTSR
jgi:hypothetical protein